MDTELFNREGDPVKTEFLSRTTRLSHADDRQQAEAFFRAASNIDGVMALTTPEDIARRAWADPNLGL